MLSIKGDKNDPLSRGYICPKGTAMEDIYTDPDRLRLPVKKQGDSWVEISWEEALQTATDWLAPIRKTDPKKLAFFTGRHLDF